MISSAFKNLMQFVSKNKIIPAELQQVCEHSSDILQLLAQKINDATLTPSDPIFDDPNCELYILALLDGAKIKEMQGYVLLEYLQMLRQYTDRQPLNSEDQAFKHQEVELIVKVLDEVELSALANTLSVRLTEAGASVRARQIQAVYRTLQGCEKWVFFINFAKLDLQYRQLLPELQTMPWIVCDSKTKILSYLSGAFNFGIFRIFNPDCPVLPQYCYGNLKPSTLTLMIQQKLQRPVTLYSPRIASNPKSQHNTIDGPVFFTLHDYYHIGAMFLLLRAPDAFRFIFHILVPALHRVLNTNIAARISENR